MAKATGLATHPARLAAIAAGAKHFRADGISCNRNPTHVLRYSEGMGCVECNREKGAAKGKARARAKGKSDREPLPAIGSDFDVQITELKLIKASEKFLKLLHAEALGAVRAGACPR